MKKRGRKLRVVDMTTVSIPVRLTSVGWSAVQKMADNAHVSGIDYIRRVLEAATGVKM